VIQYWNFKEQRRVAAGSGPGPRAFQNQCELERKSVRTALR
jgi:hypothetical protein